MLTTVSLLLWLHGAAPALSSDLERPAEVTGRRGGRPAPGGGNSGARPAPNKEKRPAPKPAPRPDPEPQRDPPDRDDTARPAPRPTPSGPRPTATPRPAPRPTPIVQPKPSPRPVGASPRPTPPVRQPTAAAQRPTAAVPRPMPTASDPSGARATPTGVVGPTPHAPVAGGGAGGPTAHHRPFNANEGVGAGPDVPSDPPTTRPPRHQTPTHPNAGAPPPHHHHYHVYYAGWYCHPWYRYHFWTSATVYFAFGVSPWDPFWLPPPRFGWAWVPGYWYYGWWYPGYWRPDVLVVPSGYVYVPGWWESDVYVEGFYRLEERPDWEWIDGYYLEDGTWIRGHWAPSSPAPDGYTWVPGFWDGEEWTDGFWRPIYRGGFRWLEGYYDAEGRFIAGYWEPIEQRPGHVWVPGWFDGNQWVEGRWITEEKLKAEDPGQWVPPAGVGDPPAPVELPEGAPLALPVTFDQPAPAPK